MAVEAPERLSEEKAIVRAAEPTGFGAYGGVTTADPGFAAVDRPPASKAAGLLDFLDSGKRWLKEVSVTTANPIDFQKSWATEFDRHNSDTRKWSETYGGRLAMRTFSRGIVGAAFYSAAQIYANKAMDGYTLDSAPKGILQHLTRFVDNTAGKSIRWAVKTATGDDAKGLKAVMFRDTRDYGYKTAGRSLGHEVVGVTFDFASMSFGDYMTRYFVGLMDPNARNKWMKDGHISVPGALKDLLANVFRGVTYAAGEDIAVSVPYVYVMKLLRNTINKFSPGFKHDSDRSLNGGSFKVNDEGKIVGNYQLEGMLDLSARFSLYNVGTKMFRDAYGAIEKKVLHWWKGDRHLPTVNPEVLTPTGAAKATGNILTNGIRYVVRTAIKVMLYMIPSTFAFFGVRSPQSKYLGAAIHPEKGPLGFTNGDGRFNIIQADGSYRKSGTGDVIPEAMHSTVGFKDGSANIPNPFGSVTVNGYERRFDPFGEKHTWHDSITNPIGRTSYDYGSAVNELLMPVGTRLGMQPETVTRYVRAGTNASSSYTEYVIAKEAGAAAWDTQRMDMSVDRVLHGAAHLKWGEFKAGFGEVVRTMFHQPFRDPVRELEAQERTLGDSEHRSNAAFQMASANGDGGGSRRSYLPPQERQKLFTEDVRNRPRTYGVLREPPKPRQNWTDEALRKFSEADLQNQSVH